MHRGWVEPTVTPIRHAFGARAIEASRTITSMPASDRQFFAAVRAAVTMIDPADDEAIHGLVELLRGEYPHVTIVDRDPLGGFGKDKAWYALRDGTENVRARRGILVVDDDPALRAVISDALDEERYVVRVAPDGAAALALLHTWTPDLILLDLQMPTMTGEDFARAYQAKPPPHAPLVVVTGARDPEDRLAGLEVRSIVSKPFDLDHLARLVDLYA